MLEIDFFFYDEMYKIDEDYFNDEMNDSYEKIQKNNPYTYTNKTFLDEARAKDFSYMFIHCFLRG